MCPHGSSRTCENCGTKSSRQMAQVGCAALSRFRLLLENSGFEVLGSEVGLGFGFVFGAAVAVAVGKSAGAGSAGSAGGGDSGVQTFSSSAEDGGVDVSFAFPP